MMQIIRVWVDGGILGIIFPDFALDNDNEVAELISGKLKFSMQLSILLMWHKTRTFPARYKRKLYGFIRCPNLE